ncbi:MAG: glycosyltransferase family 117 protein, partial [Anaerolineae bacterium]
MNQRRMPLLTAGAAFALALVVYLATLAPTITWSHDAADSGELVTAVYTGGIPHPPGYPSYLLLAAPFAHLPGWEPARGVNLFSALCAALAAGLVTLAGWHLLDGVPIPYGLRAGIAAAGGLSFAFAPTQWSQAVVAEVYALHSAFTALLLLLMARELAGGSGRYLPAAAFVLGLGLGNHLSLVLMAPALVLTAVISWRHSRPIQQVLLAGGLFLLGLSVYLLLPIRAAADPPVNWGDPRTPARFWWLVSGRLYQRFLFRLPPAALPGRLAAWAALLREQFGLVGIGLALAGIWYGWHRQRRWTALAGPTYVLFVTYAMG